MRTSRFTQQQVAAALRQVENGSAVAAGALWAACRKCGVSEPTVYRMTRKDVGIGVAELRRLRQVEDENRHWRRVYARYAADG